MILGVRRKRFKMGITIIEREREGGKPLPAGIMLIRRLVLLESELRRGREYKSESMMVIVRERLQATITVVSDLDFDQISCGIGSTC